ncbi:hypothetical protein BW81_03495 [Escherichia coli O26:H11 str. 03-3500]|nr:hypothetical protein BW81_03495 [Escherichia coli O26:H11 str. 03-3500]
MVRELRQLISRIQRQPGVGINVLHQKTPHRFHRIGKTILHIFNTRRHHRGRWHLRIVFVRLWYCSRLTATGFILLL